MFSGIIESLGVVKRIEQEKSNVHFYIHSEFAPELKIDQSIAHNGVCLTVVDIKDTSYKVTAIAETLQRSNIGRLHVNDKVNLERCITPSTRLDGHYVQGHVDTTAECISVKETGGSWYYTFSLDEKFNHLVVDKGSISVNGVSLTVVEPTHNQFKVAIIPYTYQHTNFHSLKQGDLVNLEFDILGKYIARHLEKINKANL